MRGKDDSASRREQELLARAEELRKEKEATKRDLDARRGLIDGLQRELRSRDDQLSKLKQEKEVTTINKQKENNYLTIPSSF